MGIFGGRIKFTKYFFTSPRFTGTVMHSFIPIMQNKFDLKTARKAVFSRGYRRFLSKPRFIHQLIHIIHSFLKTRHPFSPTLLHTLAHKLSSFFHEDSQQAVDNLVHSLTKP
ncbi:hypothetical protein [Paenibacillus timonensis]|uniref:hypothetical protein n=1 Tax=Paenibacillus timonensis TaxID=225915 RepID=UPI001F06D5E2|nr:hypothetical protein [Paenibacillus timonensis]